MKRFLIVACVGAALGAIATTAFAADEEPEELKGPWSGRILGGYLATSGNTENTAANLEAGVNWDGLRWHHALSGRAIGQSTDKDTTAESYKATYEANFDLSDRTYLFGLLDYNKNRFSTYTQQTFQFAGIGRRFIMTDKHQLNAEVAAGLTQADIATGGSQDEFNWRVSGSYNWNITDTSRFTQTLGVNSGSSNTFTESVTEVAANIYGALAMVLSYKIQNNSDVLPGTDKTDTFAAINLEYAFGQ
ncbi:MAG: DUF481 domain-containing protein [Gammaproteobacteria bacterium]